MGIIPSSEKRKSGGPLQGLVSSSKCVFSESRERLLQQRDRSRALAARYTDLQHRHETKAEKIEKKLAKVATSSEQPQEVSMDVPVEEIELSEEAKAKSAASVELLVEHLERGDGEESPALQSSTETLMNSSFVSPAEEALHLPAHLPENLVDETVVQTLSEPRVRYDFSVSVTRIHLDVEKKIIETKDGERRVVSASTAEIGPARYSVTWSALATLAVMVGQYAMPLNRLAKMLTTAGKRFTAGGLGRMAHYVAGRFVPIYLRLSEQLADASILAGDDTSCRVLEVSTHFRKQERAEKPPPWALHRTTCAAERSYTSCMKARAALFEKRQQGHRTAKQAPLPEPSLSVLVGRKFDFESKKRNGKEVKEALHTTVITGKSDDDAPQSMIIFYRSHLGSFGNLLEMLLKKRKPSARERTIQADLSSTNFVTDPKLTGHFHIHLAGCSAHARRPFALYEEDDPTHAAYMLHLFKGLALHEHLLDCHGRNYDNVLAVRDTDSREIWGAIKNLATKMAKRWSKATPLGTGARYILKHFEKLTAYLKEPRLEATNNLSERLLRTEKLIEKSALFRRTMEGRVVLDILRTILQTAVAAKVPIQEYLVDIMKADPEAIKAHPEHYTPHAWAARRLPPPM